MDDSDLSLEGYWLKHRYSIAALRKWKDPKGTISGYNYRMNLMAKAAPEISKKRPIRSLVLTEIVQMMELVQANRSGSAPLGRGTLDGCGSLIRDILGNAELNGLPVKNLNKFENTILKRTINDLCLNVDSHSAARLRRSSLKDLEEQLEYEVVKKKNIRKSLTMSEMRFIMKLVSKHLLEDGRYIGLAIMMYSGLRPGEVRALQWDDIHTIIEPPGFRFFEIHHVLDRQNQEIDRPKTANGYRNIPIHCELDHLLSLWREHIIQSQHLPIIDSGNTLPSKKQQPHGYICCKENSFGVPCSYNDFAEFAKKVVFRLLNQEIRDAVELELSLIKCSRSPDYDPDDDLTLYALRRNFWTWIQYGTPCTRMEKLYVMGHKMMENGVDVRPRYSTPQSLQGISTKMEKFAILQEIHLHTVILYEPGHTEYIPECGFKRIEIYSDHIRDSQTITMQFNSVEANDRLEIELCSPLMDGLSVDATYKVTSMAPPMERRMSLINESSTWEAIENSIK